MPALRSCAPPNDWCRCLLAGGQALLSFPREPFCLAKHVRRASAAATDTPATIRLAQLAPGCEPCCAGEMPALISATRRNRVQCAGVTFPWSRASH
eukprot:2774782-Pleurochrysis_carterae.AAC.3